MEKYIWYSGATDVTGQALADALTGISGTKVKPKNLKADDIVIGWGAKTKDSVSFPKGVHVLNHPDKIRDNRNKLKALEIMSKNSALSGAIADYCQADQVVAELNKNNSKIKLPLVGRTKFHQGGKGFWLCLTMQQIERAINDGAAYFQNYVDITDEYRLHVAFGKVIYAVKKIENATEAGWKNQRKEKILGYSEKNKWNLDEDTVDKALGVLYKEATLPDRIVRSNKRGWKFSSIKLNNIAAGLKDAAVESVKALGLDFGAVDCAIGSDKRPYIIEINTGPGLAGTALENYIKAFKEKLDEIENPKQTVVQKATDAAKKIMGNKEPKPKMAAAGASGGDGLAKVMQNVKTDEEARAVIEALMAERRGA
jgi:carbamoylphosphate synthase large subunit